MADEQIERFSEGELTFSEGLGRFGAAGAVRWVDVPARLFVAGTHRGRTYTTADLDQLVSTFRPPQTDLGDWDVPVQVDHSDSARDTLGHVRSVRRVGSELHGVLRFVGEEAIRPVEERRYRKLSVSIRLGPQKRLKEASVTPFPHVTQAELFKREGNTMRESIASLQAEFDRKTKELEERFARLGAGEPAAPSQQEVDLAERYCPAGFQVKAGIESTWQPTPPPTEEELTADEAAEIDAFAERYGAGAFVTKRRTERDANGVARFKEKS